MSNPTLARNEVLQLIVSQLQAYEFSSIASVVAKSTGLVDYSLDPSSRLAELAYLGKEAEAGRLAAKSPEQQPSNVKQEPVEEDDAFNLFRDPVDESKKWDLMDESEHKESIPFPDFVPGFSGRQTGIVSCAAFSPSGKYMAVAGYDNTLTVCDVDIMNDLLTGRATQRPGKGEYDDGPIFKTLYDTSNEIVHDLAFHPSNQILASCSDDRHIKFYDISRGSSRRSFRYLSDTQPVYSIAFHPGGQFLVAGTAQSNLRMYDVLSFKCFTTSGTDDSGSTPAVKLDPQAAATSAATDLPLNAITVVRFSDDGRMFSSAHGDGSVKLWDATNGRCTATWRAAHNGQRITSLQWSKSGTHLLTCGTDGTARLWEVASGRTLKAYYGSNGADDDDTKLLRPRGSVRMIPATLPAITACFTHDERHVVATDDATNEVVAFDAVSGDVVKRFDSQHKTGFVRVLSSHSSPGMVTFGDDGKYRFWGLKQEEDVE